MMLNARRGTCAGFPASSSRMRLTEPCWFGVSTGPNIAPGRIVVRAVFCSDMQDHAASSAYGVHRSGRVASMCEVDLNLRRKTRPQTRDVGLSGIEVNANRHALYNARKIACRRFERQQRELRARAWCKAFDRAFQCFAGKCINRNARVLSNQHARGLSLLEVCQDVECV